MLYTIVCWYMLYNVFCREDLLEFFVFLDWNKPILQEFPLPLRPWQPPLHFLLNEFQFSRSVVSDSLRHHESQHAGPPCPSPTPEFTQTHVHRVGDAIQPSHRLSSPFPPAFNLSQHEGLFQWVSSSHQVAERIGVSASASVLPMNTQNWFL